MILKKKAKKAKKPKKKEVRPKKAMTAYNMFVSEKKPQLMTSHPHLTNAEIFKMISEEWNSLGEDAKNKYKELCEPDRERFKSELSVFNHAKQLAEHKKAVRKAKALGIPLPAQDLPPSMPAVVKSEENQVNQ